MDKLENETWEEYVIRKDLCIISYQEDNKEIIKSIHIPFYERTFISNELNKIRTRYNLSKYEMSKYELCKYDTRYSQEDILYFGWLKKRDKFITTEMVSKRDSDHIKKYNKYKELIRIISETHKESLEELFKVIRQIPFDTYGNVTPPFPSNDYNEYIINTQNMKKVITDSVEQYNNRNIELYKKYIKNKELRLQIMELEQKINQLKDQL